MNIAFYLFIIVSFDAFNKQNKSTYLYYSNAVNGLSFLKAWKKGQDWRKIVGLHPGKKNTDTTSLYYYYEF